MQTYLYPVVWDSYSTHRVVRILYCKYSIHRPTHYLRPHLTTPHKIHNGLLGRRLSPSSHSRWTLPLLEKVALSPPKISSYCLPPLLLHWRIETLPPSLFYTPHNHPCPQMPIILCCTLTDVLLLVRDAPRKFSFVNKLSSGTHLYFSVHLFPVNYLHIASCGAGLSIIT